MSRRRIYVSAARDEPGRLRDLVARLRRHGFEVTHSSATVVEPGDNWAKRLREQVAGADLMVALITPEYITHPFVYAELAEAINDRKKIVPVCTGDDVELPAVLRPYQPVVLDDPSGADVDRLAERLRSASVANPVDPDEELRSVAAQRVLVAQEASERHHHRAAPADELIGALFRRIGSNHRRDA